MKDNTAPENDTIERTPGSQDGQQGVQLVQVDLIAEAPVIPPESTDGPLDATPWPSHVQRQEWAYDMIQEYKATPVQGLVLQLVCHMAGEPYRTCFKSKGKLAAKIHVSRDSVIGACAFWVALGVLEEEKDYFGENRRSPHGYRPVVSDYRLSLMNDGAVRDDKPCNLSSHITPPVVSDDTNKNINKNNAIDNTEDCSGSNSPLVSSHTTGLSGETTHDADETLLKPAAPNRPRCEGGQCLDFATDAEYLEYDIRTREAVAKSGRLCDNCAAVRTKAAAYFLKRRDCSPQPESAPGRPQRPF